MEKLFSAGRRPILCVSKPGLRLVSDGGEAVIRGTVP